MGRRRGNKKQSAVGGWWGWLVHRMESLHSKSPAISLNWKRNNFEQRATRYSIETNNDKKKTNDKMSTDPDGTNYAIVM